MEKNKLIIDIKQFIREVEKREPIWQPNHKYYHNHLVNHKSWMEVGKCFGMEVHEAKTKWKNLRDTYRLELKKIAQKEGSGERATSTWIYFNDMMFIKRHFKTRAIIEWLEKRGSPTHSDVDESGETESIDMMKYTTIKTEDWSPDETAWFDSSTPQVEENVNEESLVDTCISTASRGVKRVHHSDEDAEDNDMMFFRSLLPFVQKLDTNKKLKFRMDVQKLLYEAAFSN